MHEATYIEKVARLTGLEVGTVADQSHTRGLGGHEPLMYGLAGMVRYATAYRKHHEMPVSEDGVLGEPFKAICDGLRALLAGDGAVAMERGLTTDSKDNGTCEALYWQAMHAGGFDTEGVPPLDVQE